MKSNLAAALFFVALFPCAAAFAITIDTVPIGNPGNPADTSHNSSSYPNGIGSVANSFNIGRTEVTNAQYVAFLNAVAAADPYGLYSTAMTLQTWGGIVRNGESGNYTYSVKPTALNNTYAYDNKPVVYVSWGDAARFANWMHNGQPSGGQETESTTEDGAYALNGATAYAQLTAVTRNSSARWWLPSENEWYKAAYHKNDGVTGHYWIYPTATNSVPNNHLPSGDTGNSANFYNNGYTTGDFNYSLTDVGAYTLSDGPYGTYDQGGSVKEWVDTQYSGIRPIRGGAWNVDDGFLTFSPIAAVTSTTEERYLGFRVASAAVPEPSTAILAVSAFAFLATCRRRG